MTHETTSPEVAAIAARGLADPLSLTPNEIKSVCASALTQRGVKKRKRKPRGADADLLQAAEDALNEYVQREDMNNPITKTLFAAIARATGVT